MFATTVRQLNAAPAAWFAYSPDRKGEHPQQHLSNFRGILQADAYSLLNQLYADGSIQEAPCLAHIRRKFYDLMEAHRSPIATEAVERIGALYAIEKEIRGRPPDERRGVRNTRSRPLLDAMHAWLETYSRNSRGSRIPRRRSTMRSPVGHAFVRYCDDGRIEIDNSAAERAPARSRWVARRITCSPVPTPEENEPQPSIVCWARPS